MKRIFPWIWLFFLGLTHTSAGAQDTRYKIVFNVLEDRAKDNYEIYSMNMDGSGKKNISNTPGVEWVYYSYRDKVYYISDADTCHRCYFLYEMDAEGNQKRKISELQLEDSWMSRYEDAGGAYLFVMGRKGKELRNQLFLVNLADGSFRQLTSDTVSTKRDPLYIPSRSELILAYRPDKTLRKSVPDELWAFSMDPGVKRWDSLGSRRRQLTRFPAGDTSTQWFEYHAGPPQWNSRYRFISYLSRQNGRHQIFAVTPEGKKQWQITSGDLGSGWHSWSSDGKWLAMDKTDKSEKTYDIFLMNYKTGKTVQLTSDPKTEQAPVIVEARK